LSARRSDWLGKETANAGASDTPKILETKYERGAAERLKKLAA